MNHSVTVTVTHVSRQCSNGMHGFCRKDATSCACDSCHFGPCAGCGADNLLKMFQEDDKLYCAGCYRDICKSRPAPSTTCDDCGKDGAYRNPGTRRDEFRCSECHAAAGEPVVLTSSVAHLAQPCKGADLSDDRHAWVHIRGTRFQCLCGAKKYDPALRAQRRREMENEMFGSDS